MRLLVNLPRLSNAIFKCVLLAVSSCISFYAVKDKALSNLWPTATISSFWLSRGRVYVFSHIHDVLGFLNHVQVNVALTITGSNMSHIDFV